MPRRLTIATNDTLLTSGASGAPRPRLDAIRSALTDVEGIDWTVCLAAPRAAVERVHEVRYIEQLNALRGASRQVYENRSILPGSMDAIYLSAGAAIAAVHEACSGGGASFAIAEPPGHHAEPDRGMGFCAINNVAIAVADAIANRVASRVLIVDWDVHHGNGTHRIFDASPDVFFFDCHQVGLFPESGAAHELGSGAGLGYTMNVPLPKGLQDADYGYVFRKLLPAVVETFCPDLIVVSAGFDAHCDDPLGGMQLTAAGFGSLCGIVRDLAARHCASRLAMVLEGGYNARAVGASVRACAEVLLGSVPAPLGVPNESTVEWIDVMRKRWEERT